MATEPTIRIDQAAAVAKVSRRTIYNWMHAGHLPFVLVRGRRRIKPEDLACAQEIMQKTLSGAWA